MRRSAWLLVVLCAFPCHAAETEDAALRLEAARVLRRATEFFRGHVATEGGYLWRYSEDLATREGEGQATDTTVWGQPPALLHQRLPANV